jgi:hypothetical protein
MLKIKNLGFLILAFFFFSNPFAKAQTAVKTAAASHDKNTHSQANENALLWEVTGKDLSKPSYVFGTIHMIPKADFALSDAARKAIGQSDKVIFEINMKDMSNPMALIGVFMKAMMPNGTRLRDLISPEDYQLVKHRFDSIGMPIAMLERVKPMFLSVLVEGGGSMDMLGNGSDESPATKNLSYEMEIMKIAEKQKKEFGGLETMAFQMSIFDSIPYKAQAEMLVKAVKSSGDDSASEFAKMVEMYKSQDIDKMANALSAEGADTEGLGQYESMLVTTRNKNWIPLMAKGMKDKPSFYAVGAGHLGGKEGVLNLLRQEGYTLKPLK